MFIDEDRPPEKSPWSDDSDVDSDSDSDEDTEDQTDNKDRFRESLTPAIDFGALKKETDKQIFMVDEKENIKAAVVLEETDAEMVELNENTHADNAGRLNGGLRKSVHASCMQDDVRE